MHSFTSLLILFLPTLLLSAPTPNLHRRFKLKSHVLTPANPAFDNLVLEPYYFAPGLNYGTLYSQSAHHPGVIGFLNGTTEELQDEIGDLLFDGADGALGFVIDSVNSTYNPIEINEGPGTKGIFIDQRVIKYHNPLSGGFYACNNEQLPYKPAVQLFYKPKVITTPEGCSDVELVVEYI